jgi:hypothetical protein
MCGGLALAEAVDLAMVSVSMSIRIRPIPAFAILAACLLPACQPPADWEGKTAAGSKDKPAGPPAIDDIKLEKRDDGLFYQVGASEPFTGTDVEPDTVKATEESRLGFVISATYAAGKPHGTRTTYYAAGGVQEERVYENGVPKKTTTYYPSSKGGGKKVEVELNAKDVGEGKITRWYPNGKVQTDANLDAEEKWHGEFKDYNEQGELKGHYRWEHGALREIIFETPEQKTQREKDGVEVVPAA